MRSRYLVSSSENAKFAVVCPPRNAVMAVAPPEKGMYLRPRTGELIETRGGQMGGRERS